MKTVYENGENAETYYNWLKTVCETVRNGENGENGENGANCIPKNDKTLKNTENE